ncbi:MAG: alpha/beta hydrolase [Pseudodesulfovibrio sp.]
MRQLFACCILVVSLVACVHNTTSPKESPPVQTARVGNVDIAYSVIGQGEPLLMIMGYAGTMDVWDPILVEKLAESYMVIRFDNRNMGHSSTTSDTVTMETMALDTLGLLDALGIEKTHILGWSMGSFIAQEIALERPKTVDKLILYGTAYQRGPVSRSVKKLARLTPEQFMDQLFPAAWVEQNPDIYSRLPIPAIPATEEAISRQGKAIATWSGTSSQLKNITQDTLIISGDEDTVTPPKQSLAMIAKIPGSSLTRFKGAGHWLMYQAPEQVATVIDDFIRTKHDLLH